MNDCFVILNIYGVARVRTRNAKLSHTVGSLRNGGFRILLTANCFTADRLPIESWHGGEGSSSVVTHVRSRVTPTRVDTLSLCCEFGD